MVRDHPADEIVCAAGARREAAHSSPKYERNPVVPSITQLIESAGGSCRLNPEFTRKYEMMKIEVREISGAGVFMVVLLLQ